MARYKNVQSETELRNALSDGFNWIRFTADFSISAKIRLNDSEFPSPYDYRFEGEGTGGVTLTRDFGSGPLFQLDADPSTCEPASRMFWENVAFTDASGVSNSSPLLEVDRLYLSEFYDCRWHDAGGDGLQLGAAQVDTTYFRDCEWQNLSGNPVYAENAIQLNFIGGSVDSSQGFRLWGPDTGNTDGPFRFEAMSITNISGGTGIQVDDLRQCAIVNNTLDNADIWVLSGTSNCLVEGNDLNGTGSICDYGTNNWIRNNTGDAGMCPE